MSLEAARLDVNLSHFLSAPGRADVPLQQDKLPFCSPRPGAESRPAAPCGRLPFSCCTRCSECLLRSHWEPGLGGDRAGAYSWGERIAGSRGAWGGELAGHAVYTELETSRRPISFCAPQPSTVVEREFWGCKWGVRGHFLLHLVFLQLHS